MKMKFACEHVQENQNRSNSDCKCSHANSKGSGANLKQKIACDFRIANEVEMGLNGARVEGRCPLEGGHLIWEILCIPAS